MKAPLRVTVTGAAGNIGYALLFRLAAGDAFGPDQPIVLQMLEITPAMKTLEGVAMELGDCAFPLLHDMVLTDDPNVAFDGTNWALLVGAKPRSKGMERNDLILDNGPIFVDQGKALNVKAASDVRVILIGNPANTNCLITASNAPDIPRNQFLAMTRLDHNRSMSQMAEKTGAQTADIKNVIVWGNHSATQFPDIRHATIGGKPAPQVINDDAWYREKFIPRVQKRGAEIIAARGHSSAASAASAGVDTAHTWHFGTQGDEWVSMAVPSEMGDYPAPDGIYFSYPVRCKAGKYEVVQGLDFDDFGREKFKTTADELVKEREVVKHLLGVTQLQG